MYLPTADEFEYDMSIRQAAPSYPVSVHTCYATHAMFQSLQDNSTPREHCLSTCRAQPAQLPEYSHAFPVRATWVPLHDDDHSYPCACRLAYTARSTLVCLHPILNHGRLNVEPASPVKVQSELVAETAPILGICLQQHSSKVFRIM